MSMRWWQDLRKSRKSSAEEEVSVAERDEKTDMTEAAQNGGHVAPSGGSTAKPDRDLEMRVIDVLRGVYDPEIPVNIYELGLIYNVAADRDGKVEVVMTLTTPHCPVAESMPADIEARLR